MIRLRRLILQSKWCRSRKLYPLRASHRSGVYSYGPLAKFSLCTCQFEAHLHCLLMRCKLHFWQSQWKPISCDGFLSSSTVSTSIPICVSSSALQPLSLDKANVLLNGADWIRILRRTCYANSFFFIEHWGTFCLTRRDVDPVSHSSRFASALFTVAFSAEFC